MEVVVVATANPTKSYLQQDLLVTLLKQLRPLTRGVCNKFQTKDNPLKASPGDISGDFNSIKVKSSKNT
jgi:hypothetical protein